MRFTGFESCLIIREHFDNYPLMTYKLVHYMLWSQVLNMYLTGVHKHMDGLTDIASIKVMYL